MYTLPILVEDSWKLAESGERLPPSMDLRPCKRHTVCAAWHTVGAIVTCALNVSPRQSENSQEENMVLCLANSKHERVVRSNHEPLLSGMEIDLFISASHRSDTICGWLISIDNIG